jgi:hypothetical protein
VPKTKRKSTFFKMLFKKLLFITLSFFSMDYWLVRKLCKTRSMTILEYQEKEKGSIFLPEIMGHYKEQKQFLQKAVLSLLPLAFYYIQLFLRRYKIKRGK